MIACAAIACAHAAPVQTDGVAAEVGGKRITRHDVLLQAREMAYAMQGATAEKLYAEALLSLIERELVLAEYEKSQAKIPDWYFNERIEAIIEGSFGGDREKFVRAIEESGMGYAAWRQRRIGDIIQASMRRRFADGLSARPSDVLARYVRDYKGKKLPGPVKVSMILLPPGEDAQERAKEIHSALKAGASFASLAAAHSVDTHASMGGSWGYIEPGEELRKELADAVALLEKGEFSSPLEVASHWYILKKDDERPDLSIPLESVRAQIEEELLAEEAEERYRAWIEELSKKTTVRTYPLQ